MLKGHLCCALFCAAAASELLQARRRRRGDAVAASRWLRAPVPFKLGRFWPGSSNIIVLALATLDQSPSSSQQSDPCITVHNHDQTPRSRGLRYALQPRPQKTLDALKRAARSLAPGCAVHAGSACGDVRGAQGHDGRPRVELTDEALAKARNVAPKDDGGGGIELPSIKAPSFAPKEGKPRPKPRAKKGLLMVAAGSSSAPDVSAPRTLRPRSGAGPETRRGGAEPRVQPRPDRAEMKAAPADSSGGRGGAVCVKLLRRVRAESSRRPPRHRCDACSMAWRCRFLTARRSQHGSVIAEK